MNLLGIGPFELVLIMIVALLVLGPEKLPEVTGQIGKAIRDFRRMSNEVTGEFTEAFKMEPTPEQAAAEADHPGEVLVQAPEHDLTEEVPSAVAEELGPVVPDEGVDLAAGLAAIEASGRSIAESAAAGMVSIPLDITIPEAKFEVSAVSESTAPETAVESSENTVPSEPEINPAAARESEALVVAPEALLAAHVGDGYGVPEVFQVAENAEAPVPAKADDSSGAFPEEQWPDDQPAAMPIPSEASAPAENQAEA